MVLKVSGKHALPKATAKSRPSAGPPGIRQTIAKVKAPVQKKVHMDAFLDSLRDAVHRELQQAVAGVAHVIGVAAPGTPDSAGSAVKWEEADIVRKVKGYIIKAAGDPEMLTLLTRWRKLCKEFVSKAMCGYSSACCETEWFYQIDLAPAMALVVWELLSQHGKHVPPQAVHEAVEMDYHDTIERRMLEKSMWETTAGVFATVDRKVQNKIYRALWGSYWTAADDSIQRPRPRTEQQDLQLVQDFMERWMEESLIRAWHGTENATEVLCAENVTQLFELLVAPFGEEHMFTCIPGALIDRIGRPPTGWTFVAQATEEVLSNFGPDGHSGPSPYKKAKKRAHEGGDWKSSGDRKSAGNGAFNAFAQKTSAKGGAAPAKKPHPAAAQNSAKGAGKGKAKRAPVAVKKEAVTGHDMCTSEEDCLGLPTDRLVQHHLNGRAADIYCETCWISFTESNPTLEGEYMDE